MPKITIDNKEYEFENGMTVMQACEQAGTEIPRFCYHEKLSIAGNCRMCLVEMEKAPNYCIMCHASCRWNGYKNKNRNS